MRRRAHGSKRPGLYGLRFWKWLNTSQKPLSRRRRGALRIEQLEARRALYGAAIIDLAEGEAGSVVEEFSLTDENPNSSTFNQPVSPSDFAQQDATAWYFGHST